MCKHKGKLESWGDHVHIPIHCQNWTSLWAWEGRRWTAEKLKLCCNKSSRNKINSARFVTPSPVPLSSVFPLRSLCVRVCVCRCVRARVFLYMCMCVRERERGIRYCEGQSHKTMSSTNHNLFEEKDELKRNRSEAPLLTSLTPYHWVKSAHNWVSDIPFLSWWATPSGVVRTWALWLGQIPKY